MAETTPPMAPVFVRGRLRTIKREREREKKREDDRQFSNPRAARETRVRVWCNPNSKRSTNNEICKRARLEAFVGALGVKKHITEEQR